jgi:hypothetical protein
MEQTSILHSQSYLEDAEHLLWLRDNSEKVEKHHGIINHKIVKNNYKWLLEKYNISGEIVGGNYFSTPIPFFVHTDSGTPDHKPDINLLIPLKEQDDFNTVVFNQTYNGNGAHFYVGSTFKYFPDPVYNKRMDTYDEVEGLVDNDFNVDDYLNYLTHIPYAALNGLSIECVHKWKYGHGIIIPSNKLHCGGNFNGVKEGLTLLIKQ